jgi:GntR family transcriptional regulator
MMLAHGYSVTNRVVSAVERPADSEEERLLALAPGALVVQLERVRLHGQEPLIWSVDVFPRSLAPAPVDDSTWSGSLLDLLESSGSRVVSAVAQLRAVRLPEAGRRAIGRRSGEPWVLLTQRNVDQLGRVVILSRDYYRGDRFTFNVLRRRD